MMFKLLRFLWKPTVQCMEKINSKHPYLAVQVTQMFILKEILNMTHFMIHCHKILLVDSCTLFDSKIFSIVEVPSRGMTCKLPTLWFLNDTAWPEFFWHCCQSDWLKKIISLLKHFSLSPALPNHFSCYTELQRRFFEDILREHHLILDPWFCSYF